MNSDPGSARNVIARQLIVLADQGDRDAWLATRRDGLGGSDVSAICGENPHRRPIDVWNDKLHPFEGVEPPSSEHADRLEMGQYLEPVVMAMRANGQWRPAGPHKRLVWRPPMVCRRDRPWQRGSCDGLSIPAEQVTDYNTPTPSRAGYYVPSCGAFADLCPPGGGWWEMVEECKTHGYRAGFAYDDPFSDEPVPADKLIQTAWYSSIWQVPTVALSALVDTHIRRHWRWAVDPAFVTDLLTISEEWWQRHIVEGMMPDPDGSERYSKHLRRLFKDAGETVRASEALDVEIGKLRAARAAKKAAEIEAERIEQIVCASMGNAAVLESQHGKITWRLEKGRVKLRVVVDELAEALKPHGLTTAHLMDIEDRSRGEGPRVFRVPPAWSKSK